jgi:hypothetical protein
MIASLDKPATSSHQPSARSLAPLRVLAPAAPASQQMNAWARRRWRDRKQIVSSNPHESFHA